MQLRTHSEAWDRDDNWSGITNPGERRKRQNRLNQRAYRKRRNLQACRLLVESTGDATNTATQCVAKKDDPASHPLAWLGGVNWGNSRSAIEFKEKVFLNYSLHLPIPSDLPSAVRLNVLSALAGNAVALSIPFADLESDETVSPFNLHGPSSPGHASPDLTTMQNLRPTALQKAVVHHPWVDLFPIPSVRDNILRALVTAMIDEDELCSALFSIDETDDALAPLVVWADPSDTASWEFSPNFLKKWGGLLLDCPEVLEATNAWRQRSGRMKIDFICTRDGDVSINVGDQTSSRSD